MNTIRVVHLVDDTTPGGVMRMLDHLVTLPELTGKASQTIRVVEKNALSLGRIDADVIVSHLALCWRSLPALIALRGLNATRRIIHVEHSYTRAFTALRVKNKQRFFTMLRISYALFDQIIAVSETQMAWLSGRGLVRSGAITALRPQVELSHLQNIIPPRANGRVVGAFGRLEPQKGFDILIEAFRQCKDTEARLVLFGTGSEEARLKALAGSDARIEFRGHTSDMAAAYAQTDVVAMPSRWEAFGLVAQEAQAAGRLVLAAAVDGLNDQANDCIKIEADNSPRAWTRRLDELFRQRPPLCDTSRPAPAYDRAGYADAWLGQFSGTSDRERIAS